MAHCITRIVTMLAFGHLTLSATTPAPPSSTQSSTTSFQNANNVTINEKTLNEIIQKAVKKAVSESLLEIMGTFAALSTTTLKGAETPSATTSVTTTISNTCPEGVYDSKSKTVTFVLEEKQCQITLFLSKRPDRSHDKKKHKKGKGKKSAMDKNVVAGPLSGSDFDMCPDITSQKRGKDVYIIETGDCRMIVKKNKDKERKNNMYIITTTRL